MMETSRTSYFEALVCDHLAAVGGYVGRRLYPLNRDDLDDIVEETMLVIWRRLDDVPVGSERPWMIGVARNVLRNAKRSRRRRQSAESSTRARGSSASAEDHVTANDELRRALENLSETDREMILLKAWDGLSDADISHVMGISAPAVAVRVTRVREKMMLTLDGSLSRNSEPPSDSSSVEQGERS